MKTLSTILLVIALSVAAIAQSPEIPVIPPNAVGVRVVLFGHSWIDQMNGFQPWAFPNIPSQHIAVKGHPGYTCQQLLPLVASDVPATTDAVFIMAAANDVAQGVPVADHIACMETMLGHMIAENSHMLILLANENPWAMRSRGGYGDKRSVIAAYNQAYAGIPQIYPNNVVLVDMWTPLADVNGWGLPNILDGNSGTHFGPNGQYQVMGIVRDALYSGLANH